MSKCRHTESNDSQRFYDRELEPAAAAKFLRHAQSCRECQVALEDYARIRTLISEGFDVQPAPELGARFLRAARERREQSPRRIAMGLLVAASALFVSSLFLVAYTETGRTQGGNVMAQWEENVVWTPSDDDEFADAEGTTLYAIHLQADGASEDGND